MNKSLKKNSLIVFSRFNLTLLFRFKNRWCQRLDLLRLIGKAQPQDRNGTDNYNTQVRAATQ